MPLSEYGVLIGTVNRFSREDPNNYGSYYHGKIYVNTPNGQYECAVDVSTPLEVTVQYRVVHNLKPNLLSPILSLGSGWHRLARISTSGAIDYIRSPLFRISVKMFTILPLPLWIRQFLAWLETVLSSWTESTGDNALNVLEQLLIGSTQIFVYGAPYNTGLGVHDIHMNQGDPPGRFQVQDGIWQDGGVIVQRPDGEFVAFLSKFSTQSLHTNDNGLPL